MKIDKYKKLLSSHDWSYMMSDDHSVYTNGLSNEVLLLGIADNHGDLFKLEYNKFHRKYWEKSTNYNEEHIPFKDIEDTKRARG
jgi:hypothetical protein